MIEFFEVSKNFYEDVLADVHGVLLILQHPIADGVDLALVAHDQLLERVLVPCLGSLDKLSLIFHVASHCYELGYKAGALGEPPGSDQASSSSRSEEHTSELQSR